MTFRKFLATLIIVASLALTTFAFGMYMGWSSVT